MFRSLAPSSPARNEAIRETVDFLGRRVESAGQVEVFACFRTSPTDRARRAPIAPAFGAGESPYPSDVMKKTGWRRKVSYSGRRRSGL